MPSKFANKKAQMCGPQRTLSLKDEFVLILMKLRMEMTIQFLAHLFGMSLSVCSSVFNTWIKFLAVELGPLIHWPDKSSSKKHMPPFLQKDYPNLRCTLDSSETYLERPRNLQIYNILVVCAALVNLLPPLVK